ncbi:(deoxy)nucleoside triphosphate pyrophosphohydrolase [Pedobacter heparinus]|uniref:8-oxo-dGTP diphosphatase n=1 Tax=Pedobacter heparinus (strain ATCC 13125 / DSM 2366 / CIP 104194 / JCM 7457 / NBRC 12017 / NCIMB 9290 / NRRL B-14731 / HIM 762-3) TaxID=485917 RepID=C6XZC2_PEDHD|nr:(deoxy)nucleoside triphosphate pyrophosphohydrolase [Pedobacter heparinus]ACU04618.1 NUDIX hydrolase [Pedobacter heparinus DSM 2366]
MISVAAAIIFRENKVLIARRAAHKHLAGYWEFPGGKIEPREEPEACLVRELAEELMIIIQVKHHIMDHIHNYGNFTITLKAYSCTFVSGEIILTDHDEVLWVNVDDLPSYHLAPADVPIANRLMQK